MYEKETYIKEQLTQNYCEIYYILFDIFSYEQAEVPHPLDCGNVPYC